MRRRGAPALIDAAMARRLLRRRSWRRHSGERRADPVARGSWRQPDELAAGRNVDCRHRSGLGSGDALAGGDHGGAPHHRSRGCPSSVARGALAAGRRSKPPRLSGARHHPAPPCPCPRRDERGGQRAGWHRLCRPHQRSRPGDGRKVGDLAGPTHHPGRTRPRGASPPRSPEERDHAFTAFAPVGAPRYVCAVVIEHGGETGGGGSAAAAPICRDVLIEAQRRDPARRIPQPASVS